MALKHTKSTANVASKRSHLVTDLEVKLKVFKDYKSETRWWLLLASQAHPIPPYLPSKEQEPNDRNCKGSAALKTTRLAKFWEGSTSDMEKLLITRTEDKIQQCVSLSTTIITAKTKSLCATLKEKPETDYGIEFAASPGIVIHHIMWKRVVSLQVLIWKQPKNFWKL